MSLPRSILALLAFTTAPLPAADPDGMYADFLVNNDPTKSFTVQLDIPYSPLDGPYSVSRLVANFIRLAQGSGGWIDPLTGLKRTTPYFNGTKFYKNTNNRVYFGSRSGNGTDGPGYQIQDDFRSSPTTTYSLYMDNTGPNTNGGRYFISIPYLESTNTAFSRVGNVVNNYSAFPIQNGTTDVATIYGAAANTYTITSVTIRRVGAAALAFREHIHSLPEITPLKIVRSPSGSWRLQGSNYPGSFSTYYKTLNLQTVFGPFNISNPPDGSELGLDLGDDLYFNPKLFYYGAGITLPFVPSTQFTTKGSVIQVLRPSYGTYRFTFNSNGTGGTWLLNGTGGGNFTLLAQSIYGPYETRLELTGTNGLPHFFFWLHLDLDPYANPATAPHTIKSSGNRMRGGHTVSGSPFLQSPFDSTWTYLRP